MNKKRKFKQKSKIKKFLISFILIIALGFSGLVYELYSRVFQPNIILANESSEVYIFIPTNSNFFDVVNILSNKGLLLNANSFTWLAKQKKYDTNIKPGKYKIDKKLNNNELINLLRSGNQTPVNVKFNNIRTKEDLASNISRQIEADSASIINFISDTIFLKKYLLNQDNVVSIFIPNTYEFYWNTSAEEFVNRMVGEHSRFWNEKRKNKARKIGLSITDITILASIVEKEQSIRYDERSIIAGLYLNRIKRNMKLESDPTLIFALKNFKIKRVLNKDKKINSPYNTYKHKGLTPGPICIPSINAIESVLNADDHNFIFMCAKEDFSGYHNFSKNYLTHLKYAKRYQKALNTRNIMR